jgi:hypothetical protein
VTRSLLLSFAPSSRPVWGRRSLAAFFTVVALFHLTVILHPSTVSGDNAQFLLLATAAATFAMGAVSLRGPAAQEPSQTTHYRRYAVLSEQALVKEIDRLMERAARARLNAGLMLVSVEVSAGAWQDSGRLTAAAKRIVREALVRRQTTDEAVFAMRDARVAFVSLGDRTLARLEDAADAVIRESRAEFARSATLAGTALTFGITQAHPVRGSGEALLREANLALRRATALQTGRYVLTRDASGG